jgi:Cu-processing system permease protein
MIAQINIVAAKEWRDGWRNRWVAGMTLVCGIMAMGITWFGSASYGQTGPVPIEATIASLTSLTVLVIPLIALLLGYDAFVGEHEQGTLILLLTYPITKTQLVLGKFCGQLGIIFCATVIGFGSAGVLLGLQSFSWGLVIVFTIYIASATLLGAVFLAMSHFLSLLVSEKSKAAGLALLVWFFFTLLYDLSLLAVLVSTSGWLSQSVLQMALMFNPTDLFRIINLIQLDAQGSGVLASLGQLKFNTAALFMLLGVWTFVSLTGSIIKLKNKRM